MAKETRIGRTLSRLHLIRIGLGGFLIGLSLLALFNFRINTGLKQSYSIIREPVTSSSRETTEATVEQNSAHTDGKRQIVVIYKDADGQEVTKYIDIAGFRYNDSALSQIKPGDKLDIAYFNNGSSADPYPSQFNGKSEYIKSVLSDNGTHSYVYYPILIFLLLALGIFLFTLGFIGTFSTWKWTTRIIVALLESASIVLLLVLTI